MQTLDLLKKLVSIPSEFPNEKAIGDFLADYLKGIGFSVKKVKTGSNRNNIVATYGKAEKYLGFYGHMDTVPNDGVRRNPYTLQVKDNIARGLGPEDMKGGISIILQAGEYAVKNKLSVKLIFGVDEENISEGAHDLVDSHLLDDLDFLIVGESGQVDDYKKAFNICYGRKGRIAFEAVITGKKAHAAESEKGINAAEKAAEFIDILKKMKFPKHSRLGQTRIVVHSIHAETDSFSLPEVCTIRFSLMTTPGITSKSVQKELLEKAKQQAILVTVAPIQRATPYGESYEVDTKHQFVKALEKDIFSEFKIQPMYTTSVADENVFANRLKLPVISIGPIGGGGHTNEEWLDLRSLKKVEDVYKSIITLYHK